MYSDQTLDRVREANDLVELVSRYVSLQRKGGRMWGCCPFHSEKTPSFCVLPDGRSYHCFGCGAGGDIFTFVQQMERLDFLQSVEFLADRAGIAIQEEAGARQDKNAGRRERSIAANRDAALLYHQWLQQPQAKEALAYLARRGVDARLIRRFGLGYAPPEWDNLTRALLAKGYTQQELLDAGLTREGKRGGYDYFRNRILFPIQDIRDRVVGFGGRVMDDSQPKYLNTSETVAFFKGQNLYGLKGLKALRGKGSAILVEGYMDVVGLAAGGIPGAVASLGTAFTREQAKLVLRCAPRAILLYDGDAAGQRATLKVLDVASQAGLPVTVVTLPDGLDPDEFVRQRGREALLELLRQGVAPMRFRLDELSSRLDVRQESARMEYAVQACKQIGQLKSPVEQDNWLRLVSQRTGFDVATLRRQTDLDGQAPPPVRAQPRSPAPPPLAGISRAERDALHALTLAAELPELQERALSLLPGGLPPELVALRQEMQRAPLDSSALLTRLQRSESTAVVAKVLSDLQALQEERNKCVQYGNDCLNGLEIHQNEEQLKVLQEQLQGCCDAAAKKKITAEIQGLNRRLQQLKSAFRTSERRNGA